MPIFDFRCGACGRVFETLIRGEKKPLCPDCGSTDAAKLPSRFGFASGSTSAGEGKASSGSSCGSCRASSCSTCR